MSMPDILVITNTVMIEIQELIELGIQKRIALGREEGDDKRTIQAYISLSRFDATSYQVTKAQFLTFGDDRCSA